MPALQARVSLWVSGCWVSVLFPNGCVCCSNPVLVYSVGGSKHLGCSTESGHTRPGGGELPRGPSLGIGGTDCGTLGGLPREILRVFYAPEEVVSGAWQSSQVCQCFTVPPLFSARQAPQHLCISGELLWLAHPHNLSRSTIPSTLRWWIWRPHFEGGTSMKDPVSLNHFMECSVTCLDWCEWEINVSSHWDFGLFCFRN